MEAQNSPILDPNANVSYMLQSFFPNEPPDDMEYHLQIRTVVAEALELSYKNPEQITMSELRAAIQETPSYEAWK